MRMRMELGSAAGSGKSSLHSSQSDISASSTPLGKHSTGRFPLLSKYLGALYTSIILVVADFLKHFGYGTAIFNSLVNRSRLVHSKALPIATDDD